jgi:hypothetical protein
MDQERLGDTEDDWPIVQRVLPAGWQAKAKELGALRRCRGFEDAATLLRVLLIHLADGCSLRETAVRAAQGGLARVSDVALLKRLTHCGEWFRWMAAELLRAWGPPPRDLGRAARRIRVLDGSIVTEPGATGSTWRLHYAIGLPTLQRDEVSVTTPTVGESFQRFTFVFTTLAPGVGPRAVLELYRGRWRVELGFKRLKSLLALGHLRKTDPEGAKAWLQGKLLVACLIEALISAGERFFPWGYPLAEPQNALPVAGDLAHTAPGEHRD